MDRLNVEVVDILKEYFERIYHHSAPVDAAYPAVVYACITNAPARRADNRVYGLRFVYRVTVINTLEYDDTALRRAFEDAGWLWENTYVTQDKGLNEVDEIYTSIDISKLVKE